MVLDNSMKTKILLPLIILLFTTSCVLYGLKNVRPVVSPSCANTIIHESCLKKSMRTGLKPSNVQIIYDGMYNKLDVSDTCIYGVAAIDVHYRITAFLPRPKITVICALPES